MRIPIMCKVCTIIPHIDHYECDNCGWAYIMEEWKFCPVCGDPLDSEKIISDVNFVKE